MKPIYQTIFTVPGGNCLQASLASIFDMPLEGVPHFANIESDDWWQQCQEWAQDKFGVYPVYLEASSNPDPSNIRGYHLITVDTPEGSPHMTVGRNAKIVHDPAGRNAEGCTITGYVLFVSTLEMELNHV